MKSGFKIVERQWEEDLTELNLTPVEHSHIYNLILLTHPGVGSISLYAWAIPKLIEELESAYFSWLAARPVQPLQLKDPATVKT